MPAVQVKVKWNKETFEGVELNTDEEPMVFKAQLFALTGVEPSRQKVLCKGFSLRDDSWDSLKGKIKAGITLLLMGSKEEDIPAAPVAADKPQFIEDMDESEINSALKLPAGLTNLGNTCYMNATVQCLKTVPEFCQALNNFQGNIGAIGGIDHNALSITAALRDLYKSMDRGACVHPLVMLQVLHNAFPRFAERGEGGGFQQQDANECWIELMGMVKRKLMEEERQGPQLCSQCLFNMRCLEPLISIILVSFDFFAIASAFLQTYYYVRDLRGGFDLVRLFSLGITSPHKSINLHATIIAFSFGVLFPCASIIIMFTESGTKKTWWFRIGLLGYKVVTTYTLCMGLWKMCLWPKYPNPLKPDNFNHGILGFLTIVCGATWLISPLEVYQIIARKWWPKIVIEKQVHQLLQNTGRSLMSLLSLLAITSGFLIFFNVTTLTPFDMFDTTNFSDTSNESNDVAPNRLIGIIANYVVLFVVFEIIAIYVHRRIHGGITSYQLRRDIVKLFKRADEN